MIAPELIAVIYQRIGLVNETILARQTAQKDAFSNDRLNGKLDHVSAKTKALRMTVAECVELPHAQFSAMMADVENACLLFESEIRDCS